MSAYLQQEIDFIDRTIKIIKQYDTFQIAVNEKYNVTLLLNCMVGLLILPQQHWFGFLPKDLISEKEWGIKPEHISFIKKGETKNVIDFTRHLRNSIAHYRFKVFENKNCIISQIQFEDFDRNNEKTFEAVIPIANLKNFLNIFSEFIMEEMKSQN